MAEASAATSSTTSATSSTSSTTSTTTTTSTGLTLRGPCLPLYGPGTPVPISISTTSGSVVLAWWHNGDPAAIAYWVGLAKESTAAPSTYPSPTQTVSWTKVTPPSTCQELRVTVPGVERETNYTVILALEARTPETPSGVSRVVLNQAGVRLPA